MYIILVAKVMPFKPSMSSNIKFNGTLTAKANKPDAATINTFLLAKKYWIITREEK